MIKWIIGGICALVVIVGAILVIGLFKLGPLIKTSVNTYGPQLTKTEVRLGAVNLSFLSAEAELKEFFLGNPKGFKSSKAISVGSSLVNIDEKSIVTDTIIIDRIEVVAPEINYEKLGDTDNFQTILKNVKEKVKAGKKDTDKKSETAPAKEKKSGGKKILIRNFVVTKGKVHLTLSKLVGKPITADLPDIHMKNIGDSKDGVPPEEAFAEIIAELYKQVTSQSVGDILSKGLEEATKAGTERVKKEIDKQLEKVTKETGVDAKAITDQLKGFLKK